MVILGLTKIRLFRRSLKEVTKLKRSCDFDKTVEWIRNKI